MKQTDYHISITAKATPEKAVNAINNVPAWWAANTTGRSEKQGDRFTVRFGETYVDFEVTSVVPSKIKWYILDCNLHWLQDKKEWKGHTITWDISNTGDDVTIAFTQAGLTPALECYTNCEKGWNFYVGESLRDLINTGTGRPDTSADKRV